MNREDKEQKESMEACEQAIGRELTIAERMIFGMGYHCGRQDGIKVVEDKINGFD